MPTVPLKYEAVEFAGWADALIRRSTRDVQFEWPVAGVILTHPCEAEGHEDPEVPWRVPPEQITAINGKLRLFDDRGLWVQNYAEFAFLEPWIGEPKRRFAWTRLGPVEATLGDPTPLMQYVFSAAVYNNDQADGWNGISTIRLLGVREEDVERRLLQALLTFRTRLRADLHLFSLSEPEADFDDDGDDGSGPGCELHGSEFCIADIEPLQLFHGGLNAWDVEHAFLQFYRILEYYAVLITVDRLAGIRWDRTVSSTEFLRQATAALVRDERSALCELIAKTTSTGALQRARELGLSQSGDPNVVAGALYDFRNAIVHGKYDRRTAMQVPQLFRADPAVRGWKEVTQLAAADAMRALGASDT